MAKSKKPQPKPPAPSRGPTEPTGLFAALYRHQAVIEFALDGTVLSANPMFLQTMGYGIEDIRGKHHSLFVDPSYRDSADYQAFWDKLRRGEYHKGVYRRIASGGREVWLQATYNPVLDKKGKPVRVVKLAADVTAEKLHLADIEGQVASVSKARAVCEFRLDGTIIRGNQNFLNILGYAPGDIAGKPHDMLVAADGEELAESRAIWEKLAAGEIHAGVYKRLTRDGRVVRLRGNYNPILDLNGKPFKVVQYATDVTPEREQAELNAAFKGALDNLTSNVMVADNDMNIIYMNKTVRDMMSAAEGEFRKDLPNFDVNRLIGSSIDVFHKNPAHQRSMIPAMTKTFTGHFKLGGHLLRIIANPMVNAAGQRIGTVVEWSDRTVERAVENEIQRLVEGANSGDLTRRMDLEGKTGTFAEIGKGINQLIDNMALVVSQVQAAAVEVSRGADEISQGNTDLSQRTEEQASSLEETASSMEQMTSTVKQNADNASKASQLATAARDQADKGGTVVNQAIRAMTEINDSSKKIVDIIGVIDEIAFQTNLLALNAAVEAARAGEQGRGFAVVASEVRNLAGRSATAAKEIKGLIQDSVKKVGEGSALVTQSGHTLEQIVTAVKKVSDIIGEIAGASHEQSAGIEQVNKAVMQLDEMTQQNAALVEQASAASQAMASQAKSLNGMMEKYQISKELIAAAQAANRANEKQMSHPASTAPPAAAAAPIKERRGPVRPWTTGASKPAAPARPRASREAVNGNGNDSEWKEF